MKFGVLKVGSIKLKKGSLETKFVITDFNNEVEILYNGKKIEKYNFSIKKLKKVRQNSSLKKAKPLYLLDIVQM